MKKLIIFGTGKIAQDVFHYIKNDSDFEIVAFTIDREFLKEEKFFDLPVVPFDEVEKKYPPQSHEMMVIMGYHNMNEVRTKKYFAAKEKGYKLASFVSSKASNIGNVQVGENCLVLENNTIQATSKIGNNVFLWCGNHIGHHSEIKDHNYLCGQVVISGGSVIGESCFVGVNATIGHEVKIGSRNFIGARSLITKSTQPNSVFIEPDTAKFRLDCDTFLKLTKMS